MNKQLQLVKRLARGKVAGGAIKYAGIGFLIQGIGFLLLPVWTYYMTPAEYGIFGTLTAYVSFVSPFFLMGLHSALVQRYAAIEGDEAGWKRVFSSTMRFSVLSGILLFFVFWGLLAVTWKWISSGEIPLWPFLPLAVGAAFGRSLAQLVSSCFRAAEEHNSVVMIRIVQFVATTATSLILVILLGAKSAGLVAGVVAGGLFSALVGLVIAGRRWFDRSLSHDRSEVRMALAFGLPLIPHNLAVLAMKFTDRLMLEFSKGLQEVGFYSLAVSVSFALVFAIQSANQAWLPRYYRIMKNHANPGTVTRELSAVWFLGTAIAAAGMILLLPTLIRLFAKPTYFEAIPILSPLILAAFLSGLYLIFVNPLFFLKKTRHIPLVTGSAALVNIGVNLALIPKFGAVGAAWSTVICQALLVTVMYFVSRRFVPSVYRWEVLGVGVLFLVGAHLLGERFSEHPYGILIQAGAFLLAALVATPVLLRSLRRLLSAASRS